MKYGEKFIRRVIKYRNSSHAFSQIYEVLMSDCRCAIHKKQRLKKNVNLRTVIPQYVTVHVTGGKTS
jgi:hypothetical protein